MIVPTVALAVGFLIMKGVKIMELLEIKDVLPILKCNENTFRTWMKRGLLPEGLIITIGNTKRIRKTILEKWISGEIFV